MLHVPAMSTVCTGHWRLTPTGEESPLWPSRGPASRVLGPNTAAGLRRPQTQPQDSGGQEIGHQARAILLASGSVSGAKKEKICTFIVDLNLLLFVRLTSDFLISAPSTLKEENQGETRNIF